MTETVCLCEAKMETWKVVVMIFDLTGLDIQSGIETDRTESLSEFLRGEHISGPVSRVCSVSLTESFGTSVSSLVSSLGRCDRM